MKKGFGVFFLRAARAVLLILCAAATAFILFFSVNLLGLDAWREFDPSKILDTEQTLILYDGADGELLRMHSREDRVYVQIEDVPYIVVRAFVSAEDARYFEHSGIDVIRIFGAAIEDIKAGSYVQGASTITQQLIKLSHLTAEKTLSRKLEEAVLAYQMERRYSKDDILEMYLNYVYFGRGYYGIEAAAQGYFGKPCSKLTAAEGATLAGILKSPARYSPHLDMDASLGRRDHILSLMRDYGYLTEEECAAAKAEPLTIEAAKEGEGSYYTDHLLSASAKALGITTDELLTGGYRVYSYAEPEVQRLCESLFSDSSLFPAEDAQGAISVVSVERGAIVALVGGRGERVSMGFNRASDIRRQPGSVIKPIIAYAPALEHSGYTAADLILDEKTDFGGYSPDNYGDSYHGYVTLREAVTRSLNVPAVKVLNDIGVDTGKAFASRLGISFAREDASLALALGGFTYGVSPVEISGAYAAFASGGVYRPPTAIRYITDSIGNILYESPGEGERVMSEQNAYILTSMLKSAIDGGTGRRLGELGMHIAGKTGTVGEGEGNRDAWMAAYNPDYSVCVWMGYDTSEGGRTLPAEATGGNYPAKVLYALFGALYAEKEAPVFLAPEGIEELKLDLYSLEKYHTAALANAFTPGEYVYTEIFSQGSGPSEGTKYWTVPLPASDVAVAIGAGGKPTVTFRARQRFARYVLYRAAHGNLEMLKSWERVLGTVEYTDSAAMPGTRYEYYIVPVHPELIVSGKNVEGPRSLSAYIETPPASAGGHIIIEDTEFYGDITAPLP